MFSKEQEKFMLARGLIDANQKDDIDEARLEEKVSEILMVEGFEEDYKPNEVGLMCESILDNLK